MRNNNQTNKHNYHYVGEKKYKYLRKKYVNLFVREYNELLSSHIFTQIN